MQSIDSGEIILVNDYDDEDDNREDDEMSANKVASRIKNYSNRL